MNVYIRVPAVSFKPLKPAVIVPSVWFKLSVAVPVSDSRSVAENARESVIVLPVLFVGVTEIKGNFEEDDIVKIIDDKGVQIGIGKTQYDSEKARQLIGQKGQRPLVHYDYLYLD